MMVTVTSCILLLFLYALKILNGKYIPQNLHPSYYVKGIPTLDNGPDNNHELGVTDDWSTVVPYWPHYPTRTGNDTHCIPFTSLCL